MMQYKVITLDGPGGCGKSTIAFKIAQHLGYQCLNSGMLYRLIAFEQLKHTSYSARALIHLIQKASIEFKLDSKALQQCMIYNKQDITTQLHMPEVASMASQLAQHPEIRAPLIELQQQFLNKTGLVAEGRDMGTCIFPQATLKCYLTATPEIRALRRQKQLIALGKRVNLGTLIESIVERDQRDESRSAAPMRPADDAFVIDTSKMTLDSVCSAVLEAFAIATAAGDSSSAD
ncbi:MAG: cytidylate kinase [Legionellales bacterium]|nr:cytidylate kinase [Legionellales bacterium]